MRRLISKIVVSCKKATLLTEKGKWTRLTIKERFRLRLHNNICVACKKFTHQSDLIDEALQKLSNEGPQQMTLSEDKKMDILEQLHKM
jgi:hypothetical protein